MSYTDPSVDLWTLLNDFGLEKTKLERKRSSVTKLENYIYEVNERSIDAKINEQIFEAILKWAENRLSTRIPFLCILFKSIPLYRLTQSFLEEKFATEQIFEFKLIYGLRALMKDAIKKLSRNYSPQPECLKCSNSFQLYCFGGLERMDNPSYVSCLDLSTGIWSRLSSMQTNRTKFGGVIFDNRIYLCGGSTYDGMNKLDTFEMFDCKTHTWTQLEPLPEALDGCAVAAMDGCIYVSGGLDSSNSESNSVFRYNLSTFNWERTVSMEYERYGHQLVELDGYLYAISGMNTKTVEKYDKHTGEWSMINETQFEHCHFSATTHNGNIYVCSNRAFEVYCPAVKKWKDLQRGSMGRLNNYIGKTLMSINNKLWTMGGKNSNGDDVSSSILSYDISIRKWTEIGEMDIPRWRFCCFKVRDKSTQELPTQLEDLKPFKLVKVGFDNLEGNTFSSTFFPMTQTESTLKSSYIDHIDITEKTVCGTIWDNKIYMCGYREESMRALRMYDCITKKFTRLKNVPESRIHCASASMDGFIYVSGGVDSLGNVSPNVFRYNIMMNEWENMRPMQMERSGHALIELNGRLYAIGDLNSNTVEEYDPKTDQWKMVASLLYEHFHFSAASYRDKIYVLSMKGFEVYTPENDFWSSLIRLKDFWGQTLVSVNEKLLAVGGQRYNKDETLIEWLHRHQEKWEGEYAIKKMGSLEYLYEYDIYEETWKKLRNIRWSTEEAKTDDNDILKSDHLYCFDELNPYIRGFFVFSAYNPNLSIGMFNIHVNIRVLAGVVIGSDIYLFMRSPEADKRHVDFDICNIMKKFDCLTHTCTELEQLPQLVAHSRFAAMDNFIYVTGGYKMVDNQRNHLSTVFRYDVKTNQWKEMQSMARTFVYHKSVALNSRLYIIGEGMSTRNVDEYDPITDEWRPVANTIIKHKWQVATVTAHNGNIYVLSSGGFEVYFPGLNIWNQLTLIDCDILCRRQELISIKGQLWLVEEGDRWNKGSKSAYQYDEYSGEWGNPMTLLASSNYINVEQCEQNERNLSCLQVFHFGRDNKEPPTSTLLTRLNVSTGECEKLRLFLNTEFCAALIDTKIYVCGWEIFNIFEDNYNSMEVFDCKTGVWTIGKLANMPELRRNCAAAAIGHFIYVTGGWDETVEKSAEVFRYNTQTDEWKKMKSMLLKRTDHQLVALNDRLYAIYDPTLNSCEEYNPTTDEWKFIGVKAEDNPLKHHSSACSYNGKIYIYSGYGFETYSPDSNEWQFLPHIKNFFPRSLVAVNDKIWALGGCFKSYSKTISENDPQYMNHDSRVENKKLIVENTKAIFEYDVKQRQWLRVLQDLIDPYSSSMSFVVKTEKFGYEGRNKIDHEDTPEIDQEDSSVNPGIISLLKYFKSNTKL